MAIADNISMSLVFPKDFFKKYAESQDCLIRIAPVAGHDCSPGTTVLCHPSLAGYKAVGSRDASIPDIGGAWGCRVCHDICDGRIQVPLEPEIIKLYHLEGTLRTIDALVKAGVLPNP